MNQLSTANRLSLSARGGEHVQFEGVRPKVSEDTSLPNRSATIGRLRIRRVQKLNPIRSRLDTATMRDENADTAICGATAATLA